MRNCKRRLLLTKMAKKYGISREGRVATVQNKSKKATPDAVSIRQPKTNFEFGLFSVIPIPKGTSQFLVQFLPSSVYLRFILIFSQKTSLAVRHHTARFSTHYTIILFIVFKKIKQAVYACQNQETCRPLGKK